MIRFVTSIAFANESELGWDPTIQRERIPSKYSPAPVGAHRSRNRSRLTQLDTELRYIHAQPGTMDMNVPLSRQCTEPPGISSTMERTH
jgi:hypothetical protein